MKKGKRDFFYPHHVRLAKELLFKNEEWKGLSLRAKILYMMIKAKYNGSNNGSIRLHYSEIQDIPGFKSPNGIANAIQELEKNQNWIERTKHGGLHRYFNEFRLTGKHDKLIGEK